MNPDKLLRYAKATIKHPDRVLISAISDITGKPTRVSFNIEGEDLPIEGILPDIISRYLYLMEGIRDYEPETGLMMRKIIKPGDTVLIAGAHIGTHAIQAKQLVKTDGKVIAFGPSPQTFELLSENCIPRGIICEPLAITKADIDTLCLTVFDKKHSAWNSTVTPRTNNQNKWKPEHVTVKAVSIDDYSAKKLITPDVLILDLENGESDAINGGLYQIGTNKPKIILECGDQERTRETSTFSCLSKLQSFGYELYEGNNSASKLVRHNIMPIYPDYYPNVLAVHPDNSVEL